MITRLRQGAHEESIFTVKTYSKKKLNLEETIFLKGNHIFSINYLFICIENHLCVQNQLEKLREKKKKISLHSLTFLT